MSRADKADIVPLRPIRRSCSAFPLQIRLRPQQNRLRQRVVENPRPNQQPKGQAVNEAPNCRIPPRIERIPDSVGGISESVPGVQWNVSRPDTSGWQHKEQFITRRPSLKPRFPGQAVIGGTGGGTLWVRWDQPAIGGKDVQQRYLSRDISGEEGIHSPYGRPSRCCGKEGILRSEEIFQNASSTIGQAWQKQNVAQQHISTSPAVLSSKSFLWPSSQG